MVLKLFLIQTVLAAVISGVSFYRYGERDTLIRRIAVLFFMSFLFNCLQYMALMFWSGGTLNFFGTLYDFVFVILVTRIYIHIMDGKYEKAFVFTAFLVQAWNVANVMFFQNMGQTTSLSKLAISLMILSYAIVYFFKLMRDLPTVHVHRLPAFWINSGFLFYAAGTVFLFGTVDYLVRVLNDSLTTYWPFHNVVFIIQELIILTGLYYDLQNRSKFTSH